MSPEDDAVRERAVEFARANKRAIAEELTDVNKYPPVEIPISVFMAGSPGAGKTESSIQLIKNLSDQGEQVLRIDADELRPLIPEYTGANSSLFQGATSIVADRMQDLALKKSQNFIFDGTLTNLEKARENISRSIKCNRLVFIIYVYQDPKQAWDFSKQRELKEGRKIPKEVFINQYFRARENVNKLKEEFGKALQVFLIVKNIDGSDFNYWENINRIDDHIPQRYTQDELTTLLSEMP